MLKLFVLFITLFVTVSTSNAAFNESKAEKKETGLTSSSAFESAIAGVITNLNRRELEKITGRHLTFGERIAFTLLKFNTRNQQKQESTNGFNTEGFLLGFLITVLGAFLGLLGLFAFGLIGLLVVISTFIFSKDKNYQKWMLLGWLAGIVASLVILFIELRNYG